MSLRLTKQSIASALLLVMMVLLLPQLSDHDASAQTIPSRTPTPSGGQATATDEPGEPGPNPTVPPTSTNRPPQSTATVTPFVLPPTPEDGYLPTAEPCSVDVTARALAANINVRSGPGLAYDIVGTLVATEVRPVTGRAPEAAWWQIILADGTFGWVSDDLMEISGYTGLVPIVAPPPVGQMTVTPAATWEPTPRPQCTPPPTATATPTMDATTTSSPTAEEIDAAQAEGEPEIDESAQGTFASPTTTVQATETATPPPTSPPATAAPLPGEEEISANAGSMWVPIVGVVLILAAAGLFVAERVRR